MMGLLRNAVARLLSVGEDKEQLILDLLSEREMFGSDIAKASNGRLGRGGLYARLADMEQKGLLTSRDIKKIHTIREVVHGKVHATDYETKQRLYRRGIPPAQVL
jgi:hypothetical protein